MSNDTRKPAEDGGARGPMTRINYTTPMSTYPLLSDSRAERDLDLQSLMAAAARYYLDNTPSLTPQQKQLLRDIEKRRYQFKALASFLEIAPLGTNPLTLSDVFRRATLLQLPAQPESIVDATIDETLAQAALDPWQMRLLNERTDTIRDATLDRSGVNLVKLQRYHDLLLRMPINGRRTFS